MLGVGMEAELFNEEYEDAYMLESAETEGLVPRGCALPLWWGLNAVVSGSHVQRLR